jgi:hypothetical protein
MSNFEFVFSLFGLLLGLALAEVLGGFGRAVEARRKVRMGWLTPLLGLVVALDLTSFWTIAWTVRDAIPASYISILCGFVLTGIYYLVARLVFPHDPAEWPDYDPYYFAHKRVILGGVLLCNLLAIAGQVALGNPLVAGPGDYWSMGLFFIPLALAIWAPGKRFNLALLVFLTLYYPALPLIGLLSRA